MRPGFFTTMTTGSKGSLYALLQQALPRECLQPAIGMGAEGSPPSAAQADMGQAGREASGEPSQLGSAAKSGGTKIVDRQHSACPDGPKRRWHRLAGHMACVTVFLLFLWSIRVTRRHFRHPHRKLLAGRHRHWAPWWRGQPEVSAEDAELLRRYCPVLCFDSAEPVAPMSLTAYVHQSSLRRTRDGSLLQPSARLHLHRYRGHRGRDTYLEYEGTVSPPGGDIEDVPFYASTTRMQWRGREVHELLYMFWYPYNAPYRAFRLYSYGSHMGDLEHVRLIVDAASNRIQEVYYGAHGHADGMWMAAEDLHYHDGARERVMVYPGRGSHANYPHPGTHGRFLGMADDHNDRAGITWNARARLVEPWPPRLMRFGGRLSKHVVNVWQQAWWQFESPPDHSGLPLTSWYALKTAVKGRRLLAED